MLILLHGITAFMADWLLISYLCNLINFLRTICLFDTIPQWEFVAWLAWTKNYEIFLHLSLLEGISHYFRFMKDKGHKYYRLFSILHPHYLLPITFNKIIMIMKKIFHFPFFFLLFFWFIIYSVIKLKFSCFFYLFYFFPFFSFWK